jgi:alpha-tubulin suppressor-like RCC1 family protein
MLARSMRSLSMCTFAIAALGCMSLKSGDELPDGGGAMADSGDDDVRDAAVIEASPVVDADAGDASKDPNFALDVAAGGRHTCAIEGGALTCWGANPSGELGNGMKGEDSYTPVPVTGLTSGVTAVSAGYLHTCAIRSGALTCWGANDEGQLGNGGGTTSSNTPAPVTGLTSGVTAVSTGYRHTCAIQGGALTCWGANNYGQLGNGETVQSNTPVPVTGLTSGVTAVSAGYMHTCAIQNGAVKCWGWNEDGQLGNGKTVTTGTTADSATPVPVTGLTSGVSAVSAGFFEASGGMHTCAIQSGALKCWGWNVYGQLGNGRPGDSYTPVAVIGLTSGVSAVSAASGHTCAIQNGALTCWGKNYYGQLGNGTTDNRSTPLAVTGLTSGVSAISATGKHTCAIQNGALKCWGLNDDGQLGNGKNTASATPVQVMTLAR